MQIALPTSHLHELSQLLSGLFDAEIIPCENGVLVQGEQCFFLTFQKNVNANYNDFQYSFFSEEEFASFFNKVNFLRYRQNLDPIVPTKTDLEHSFAVTDPDGRLWQFAYGRQNKSRM